jgi:tagaturonate reductase
VWLKSLVDCIVVNAPADHPRAARDRLLVCAEPYALWALERPAGVDPGLFAHPALHVVDDLSPYFLRKVRILNGTHSAMAAKFRPAGFETVQQVLADREAARWVRDLMYEEIVPVLAARLEGVAAFADQTYDRLRNPFQAHKLADIAMNHEDKARVRLRPTFEEYVRLYGKAPRRLGEVIGA